MYYYRESLACHGICSRRLDVVGFWHHYTQILEKRREGVGWGKEGEKMRIARRERRYTTNSFFRLQPRNLAKNPWVILIFEYLFFQEFVWSKMHLNNLIFTYRLLRLVTGDILISCRLEYILSERWRTPHRNYSAPRGISEC